MPSPAIAPPATLPEHPPRDPMMTTTPICFESRHAGVGVRSRVLTNDARIHAAAIEGLGPDPADDVEPEVTIRLFVHHLLEEEGWRPRQPVVRRHGPVFVVTSSRASSLAGHYLAGDAAGFVSDEAASHRDFLRSCFLQSAHLQFAQDRALVAIHTACLWRDGRSVLVRGLSGAGKSTLCYAALRCGWSLVAEDVVFITARAEARLPLRPDDIAVHGLPWTLHLLPDARQLFPELAGEPAFERPDGDLKIGVIVHERFPGQARPDAPLGPLVFVARGAGAPRLRQIDADEALPLLHDTVILDEREVAERTGLWDAFLAQPAWLLETGDEPDASAALLETVIGV